MCKCPFHTELRRHFSATTAGQVSVNLNDQGILSLNDLRGKRVAVFAASDVTAANKPAALARFRRFLTTYGAVAIG